MSSAGRVGIPLLARLIPGGIKPATLFIVKYDPESQWLAIATTITARYVEKGFHAIYAAANRSPENARNDLERLGLNVSASEEAGLLRVDDWYSATLSPEARGAGPTLEIPSKGGATIRSLKVADLSIEFQRAIKEGSVDPTDYWPSGSLAVLESLSPMLRFNEEKTFLEWAQSRFYPFERKTGRIDLLGYALGVHSESFYKRIEDASDGVIEVRVLEREDEIKNVLRVRSLKSQPHDSRWHEIELKPNGEATLVS